MSKYLDRGIQRDILIKTADLYPQVIHLKSLLEGKKEDDLFTRTIVNMAYLEEHNLIHLTWSKTLDGIYPVSGKITAKGLDFLADDGGLSAILGVVTVKLHSDTIKDLLITKIEKTGADPTVKKNLIDAVKKLPADAMTRLSMAAVQQGIDNLPNALQWIQKLLHSL